MARTRNIKPGFFQNDQLAECSPLARLLFAGLWCWADKDGRMEYRPKRLKVEILPYDNADVQELVDELSERGFVRLYESEGQQYLDIPKFSTHQNPHKDERAKGLPAFGKCCAVDTQCKPGATSVVAPQDNGSDRALTDHRSPSSEYLSLTTVTVPPEPEAPAVRGRAVAGFGKIQSKKDLQDTGKVLSLVSPHAAEVEQLRILGAAERALECGDKPPAMFVSLVKEKNWKVISEEQDERARRRLRDHNARAGPAAASLVANAFKLEEPP